MRTSRHYRQTGLSGRSRLTAVPQVAVLVLILVANLLAQESSGTSVITRGKAAIGNAPRRYAALLPRPAPIVTVSGRVLDFKGRPAAEAIVILIPREPEATASRSVQRTAQTDAEGNFALRGILPGAYLLVARLAREAKEYWSEQRIEVTDSDVSGVQLQLRGAVNLSGSVVAVGGITLDFHQLQTQLSPEDGNSPAASAEAAKDGTFNLAELRPTTYRLQVTGLPGGWYLHSAAWGTKDVLANGLILAEGSPGTQLRILVGPGAANLHGVVLDPEFHDTVPNAVVRLFPEPPNPAIAGPWVVKPTHGNSGKDLRTP